MKYQNLVEVLEDKIKTGKGITFIKSSSNEKFIEYKELYQAARQMLFMYQKKGLTPDNELVIQLGDNEAFLKTVWSGFLGNMIPVPLAIGYNDEHRLKLLKVLINLNDPHLITTRKNFESIEKFMLENGFKTHFESLKEKTLFYEQLIQNDKLSEVQPGELDETAFIQFSSGSTGDPKGVVLTHENIITNLRAIVYETKMTEDDSSLSWMPLTHDMGFIGFHLAMLYGGVNQYFMPTNLFIRTPTLWIKKASKHQITLTSSPNFGYKHFLNIYHRRKKRNDYNFDLSSIRLIFNGAEPISKELCNRFLNEMEQYDLKRTAMFTVYGLAEASLAVTFPPLEEEFQSIKVDRKSLRVNSPVKELKENNDNAVDLIDVGYPVKDCKVRIVDGDNKQLDEKMVGYIQMKGGNVTEGYYNDKQKTEEVTTSDGWVDTGDLGFMKNGRLIITGRAKEVIFSKGQNYYPHDLERIIEEVDIIKANKVAFIGFNDNELREDQILAFIKFRRSIEKFIPIQEQIKKAIMKKIGLEVEEAIPVRKFPKTTSGKVKRYKLAQMYRVGKFDNKINEIHKLTKTNQQDPEDKMETPSTELEKQIADVCKEIFEIDSIGINENFIEYGGDSFKLTQLHNELDKLYPGKLKVTDFFESPTISQIVDLLKADKRFTIPGIKLPTDFFRRTNDQGALFAFTIENDQLSNLKQIAEKEEIEITDILIAAYAFVFKEIAEIEKVNLEIITEQLEFFKSLTIDFSQDFVNFGDYFKHVNKLLAAKDSDRLYSYYDLERLELVKEETTVFPLFYEQKSIQQQVDLLKNYDLALEVAKKKQDSLEISLQFAAKRLNKDKIKKLFENYINCINSFIDNYHHKGDL